MNDPDFLRWLHDRLVEVYGENPNFDYMRRLREIIEKLEDLEDATHTH